MHILDCWIGNQVEIRNNILYRNARGSTYFTVGFFCTIFSHYDGRDFRAHWYSTGTIVYASY